MGGGALCAYAKGRLRVAQHARDNVAKGGDQVRGLEKIKA